MICVIYVTNNSFASFFVCCIYYLYGVFMICEFVHTGPWKYSSASGCLCVIPAIGRHTDYLSAVNHGLFESLFLLIQQLRSVSTMALELVPSTLHLTSGNRPFPAAAALVSNSFPQLVTYRLGHANLTINDHFCCFLILSFIVTV